MINSHVGRVCVCVFPYRLRGRGPQGEDGSTCRHQRWPLRWRMTFVCYRWGMCWTGVTTTSLATGRRGNYPSTSRQVAWAHIAIPCYHSNPSSPGGYRGEWGSRVLLCSYSQETAEEDNSGGVTGWWAAEEVSLSTYIVYLTHYTCFFVFTVATTRRKLMSYRRSFRAAHTDTSTWRRNVRTDTLTRLDISLLILLLLWYHVSHCLICDIDR